MLRRWQYVLGFLLYLGTNVIVIGVMGMPIGETVVWALSNTLPSALLGILVVRYYNTRRVTFDGFEAVKHLFFGFTFAILSVTSTTLLSRILIARPFVFRLESFVWGVLIAGLVYTILASIAHLQRVQSELAAAETSRAKAELAALRARIDPHFLFNTLHSLLALVRQDPGRAEEAIEQFGDLLRYTFSAGDGSEERTLQQEWELVDNYLALERLRLGARLRVDANIDDGVASVPLPVLTLQPLVENAVRHAIAPRGAGGRIDLRAERRDGGVRITVSDDGPGLTSSPKAGRGLDLVRQRLAHLYGTRAHMDLAQSAAGGVQVTIDLDT